MFLFRLFGSNINAYDYYKLINKSKKTQIIWKK